MPAVMFRQDTCTVALHLEKLCELPVANVRKLFAMMLSEPWNNEDAIQQTGAFLNEIVPESKELWHLASIEFQNGWRLVRNKRSRAPDVVEKLNRNKQLTRAVKRAKAQYERWEKIRSLWAEAQQ